MLANDSIADAIQRFINSIYSYTFAFVSAMASVGVVTMAIIQTIKDIFPVRRAFQRSWLNHWLASKADDFNSTKTSINPPVSAASAEKDLIRLATDNNSNAFYDLPIEQLCGQFNAAIQVALDYPGRHRDLLFCAASQATVEDLNLLMRPPELVTRPQKPPDAPLTADEAQQRQAFVDARNRVTHYVQRAIDAIQISAGSRWKWLLQLASFVLSGLITYLGVTFFLKALSGNILTALVIAFLGGFLAPVARDLVAALQQARK